MGPVCTLGQSPIVMGREEKCIIYENQRYYGPMGWCADFQELSLEQQGQKKERIRS